jgi:hypothetical protein
MVATNDPQHPQEKLVCKGKLLEPVRITPEFVNLGRLPADAPSQSVVSIGRGDGPPIAPKVAPINTQGLSATIKEITPGERYDLVLTLTPPLRSGRFSNNIQLETGVPQAPNASVSVLGVVAPPRAAEPTTESPPQNRSEKAPTANPAASPTPRS